MTGSDGKKKKKNGKSRDHLNSLAHPYAVRSDASARQRNLFRKKNRSVYYVNRVALRRVEPPVIYCNAYRYGEIRDN